MSTLSGVDDTLSCIHTGPQLNVLLNPMFISYINRRSESVDLVFQQEKKDKFKTNTDMSAFYTKWHRWL